MVKSRAEIWAELYAGIVAGRTHGLAQTSLADHARNADDALAEFDKRWEAVKVSQDDSPHDLKRWMDGEAAYVERPK